MIRASNLETVNKSWTLVAALTLIQFTNVREATGSETKREKNTVLWRSTVFFKGVCFES